MKINYCLPIIKNNKEDVLQMITDNKNDYQYFEVWIDYIKNLDNEFLKKLVGLLQEQLIILLRRKSLEKIKMPLEKRIEIMNLLNNSQALFDLDISQKEELDFIKNNNKQIKIIVSYHNYSDMPDNKKMDKIIDEMKKYNPTIYKIATFCKTGFDALSLLQLQQKLKQQNKKHIILGMGKFGTITRVFGTLFGNEMIFAPKTLGESSAQGQLTKEQLEKVFLIFDI